MIMLDLDRFKSINDTYGHAAGDQCLIATANILEDIAQEYAIIGRLGGEEFGLIMTSYTEDRVIELAEEIRAEIEAEAIKIDNEVIHLTASIGISICHESEDIIDPVIDRADKALYQAKHSGRNKVISSIS